MNQSNAFPPDLPVPAAMTRPGGGARYAYVTFIIRNDGFLPGALLYAYALRTQGARADTVCLVSQGVSAQAVRALEQVYHRVIRVDEVYVDNANKGDRNDLPYLFTRFHALRLGRDGDLGTGYDKIVVADSDVLPLRYYDHLFTLNTPAGVLNEKPEHFLSYDEHGQYIVPDSAYRTGEWKWHQAYNSLCPHGKAIPAYITDRVREDPANMGVNSALYVVRPSYREFLGIFQDLSREETRRITASFRWPEMQYLTMAWSGRWHNIDPKFCGFKGYPDYSVLYGIHYAGRKPWLVEDGKSLHRMLKFPDNIVWYAYYLAMTAEYPQLLEVRRLRKLHTLLDIPQIRQMTAFFFPF